MNITKHFGKAGSRKHNSVILNKEDFSQHANDLQVWEALTEGLPEGTENVTVLVVGSAD